LEFAVCNLQLLYEKFAFLCDLKLWIWNVEFSSRNKLATNEGKYMEEENNCECEVDLIKILL
jgi:hypothetical protein